MALISYYLAQLKDVTMLSIIVRLFLAALLGGIIGMERGRRRRAAGLRTHMLVCMGAALVMVTNQYIFIEFGASDPSRLGAQVISGIGFLGVGTIIVDKQQQVKGLTTAAGLWTCACMGLALGIGFYAGAIIACLFILITVIILNRLEREIINKSKFIEVYAEFENHSCINRFINYLTANSVKVVQVEIVQPRNHANEQNDKAASNITLKLPKRNLHSHVLEEMDSVAGVVLIEELS